MCSNRTLRFEIHGQEVLCYQTDTHRLWHCACGYFQRMLEKHHEGFCPHVALAIEDAMAAGLISLQSR